MQIQTSEARIILAIEAIRTSRKKLSRRKAAKIYNVPESSLRLRMNGATTIHDCRPKVQKLTELEEEIIIQHIFSRDDRGFSPRLANVEDMANHLLESWNAKRVGKC
jgi:helix-turn-helix, Psq domain